MKGSKKVKFVRTWESRQSSPAIFVRAFSFLLPRFLSPPPSLFSGRIGRNWIDAGMEMAGWLLEDF
jgi:hypothetical protein